MGNEPFYGDGLINISNHYGALRCFVFSVVSSSDELHLYVYKQFYMSTVDF